MNQTKHPHWVPCFYLKYFATPETSETSEPQVWILSKDERGPSLVNIKKIAQQRYLYSPKTPDGTRSWDMENDLGKYETVMGTLWPMLATDFVELQDDEAVRKGLALFISLLYLRHPRRLVETEELHGQLVEMFDTAPKDQDGRPLVEGVEHNGVLRKIDTIDWQRYKGAGSEEKKEIFVKSIRLNATHLAEILIQKRWSVVFSETPVFITTDAPVMLVHQTREVFGFGTPGTIVSFPLSPTRVLMMDDRHDQPKGQYYPLATTGPAFANGLAWRNCERFMISPRHPDEVCAEILETAE